MVKPRILITILSAFLFLPSCKKDSKVVEPTPAPVVTPVSTSDPAITFDFKAFVNNQVLKDSTWYLNFNADSFRVSRFNYYISNIKLIRADGFSFAEPESYHLVRHIDKKETFTISKVPAGTYTAIEFIIGVDSARNVAGAQTGDLAVDLGMFWEWNTGYIFFKIEGDCHIAKNPDVVNYAMHIGGYTGRDNCLQKCVLSLTNPVIASTGKISSVFYHTNIETIFKNYTALDIETISLGGSQYFKAVSDNYRDMIKVDHIQN